MEGQLNEFVKEWDGNEANLTDDILDNFLAKACVNSDSDMQKCANRIVLRALIVTLKEKGTCCIGSITLLLGPMMAGKTTELQKRFCRCFLAHPDSTLCIIPRIDTRYTRKSLSVSHDGKKVYATRVDSLEEDPSIIERAQHIFIDEGQFIRGLAAFCLRQKKRGKHVTVAALSSDFRGNAWEEIAQLVPVHVAHIYTYTGVCLVCKKDAYYTRKIGGGDGGNVVDVGGSEKYVTVCYEHFDAETHITQDMLEERADTLYRLRVSE